MPAGGEGLEETQHHLGAALVNGSSVSLPSTEPAEGEPGPRAGQQLRQGEGQHRERGLKKKENLITCCRSPSSCQTAWKLQKPVCSNEQISSGGPGGPQCPQDLMHRAVGDVVTRTRGFPAQEPVSVTLAGKAGLQNS